jgi:DNA-binding FadR family transcriptional regulator
MFNQAQLARLANVSSAAQQSYADTVHLEHHRALLRALHNRDSEAARAAVQEHFGSLGLMLGVMTASRSTPRKLGAKKEKPRNANRQSKTKKE